MMPEDWHDVDEIPDDEYCNYCKGVCVCDYMNDMHDEQELDDRE